ncbi:MAG: hypothetical protein JSS90_09550 [Bacteroidetes bacterium]|jgi:hypothetical protein|nr:hypothetical protein [Bacteroidota bacterium]
MRGKIYFFIAFVLLFLSQKSVAQKGIITAGFQFKPIFNNDFFGAGAQSVSKGGAMVTVKPNSGYCAGMVIRRGFSNRISLESGINYTRRNYTIQLTDTNYSHQNNFKFIGYEIPVSLLVYIRLGQKIFMDASLGNSFDFYPSDIYIGDDEFESEGLRKSWIKPALIANLGAEYRTEKAGYFYLGFSFHRPYSFIYRSRTLFSHKNYQIFQTDISGNYLTVDIRYFFNEEPLNKQKKRYDDE